MPARTPTLVILTGPNGAGKTTVYQLRVAPTFPDLPFINADHIQRDELHAGDDMQRAYEAARIADARRAECLRERRSFVTESVFSHPSKLDFLRQAKSAGYTVIMVHVGVDRADTSVARVQARTQEGGQQNSYTRVQSPPSAGLPSSMKIRRIVLLEPISKLFKKHSDGCQLNKAQEVAGVVLPSH